MAQQLASGGGAASEREKELLAELAKKQAELMELRAQPGSAAPGSAAPVQAGSEGGDVTTDSLLNLAKDAKSSYQRQQDAQVIGPHWAEALSTFEGEYEGELSFEDGEFLVILGGVGKGWLDARVGESVGFVPETWVERLMLQPAVVLSPFTPSGAETEPSAPRRLVVEEGDTVGVLDPEAVTTADGQVWAQVIQAPGSARPVGPGYMLLSALRLASNAIAVQAFAADDPLERSLVRGQRVWVLEQESEDNGWSDIMTIEGVRGFVPSACLKVERSEGAVAAGSATAASAAPGAPSEPSEAAVAARAVNADDLIEAIVSAPPETAEAATGASAASVASASAANGERPTAADGETIAVVASTRMPKLAPPTSNAVATTGGGDGGAVPPAKAAPAATASAQAATAKPAATTTATGGEGDAEMSAALRDARAAAAAAVEAQKLAEQECARLRRELESARSELHAAALELRALKGDEEAKAKREAAQQAAFLEQLAQQREEHNRQQVRPAGRAGPSRLRGRSFPLGRLLGRAMRVGWTGWRVGVRSVALDSHGTTTPDAYRLPPTAIDRSPSPCVCSGSGGGVAYRVPRAAVLVVGEGSQGRKGDRRGAWVARRAARDGDAPRGGERRRQAAGLRLHARVRGGLDAGGGVWRHRAADDQCARWLQRLHLCLRPVRHGQDLHHGGDRIRPWPRSTRDDDAR